VFIERIRTDTNLDAEVTAIDVVAEEEIPCICRVPADLEQLHQVELCFFVSVNLQKGLQHSRIVHVCPRTLHAAISPGPGGRGLVSTHR
jgi:hypothetical protein